jgi:hypothetical protein
MSATVTWSGLDELRADLRNLPAHLATEASAIVWFSASQAKADVVAGYTAHRRTGNLADHVSVTTREGSPYGTAVVVKSSARHAWMFENGTQARHNSLGANRGSMPPGHVFIPAMIRHRRQMYVALQSMMERAGLRVSGSAT